MKERARVHGAAVEEVVQFLRKVPPFQFLEDQPLREVARVVSLEYYPTGALILEQNGPPSENLLVIKKGGAKIFIRSDENEETLVDYRAEGDIIGFLSQRPKLDYFHIGFVIVAADGGLWLRHASKSRRRVLDEPLVRFLKLNRVKAVTVLRAMEPESLTALI